TPGRTARKTTAAGRPHVGHSARTRKTGVALGSEGCARTERSMDGISHQVLNARGYAARERVRWIREKWASKTPSLESQALRFHVTRSLNDPQRESAPISPNSPVGPSGV